MRRFVDRRLGVVVSVLGLAVALLVISPAPTGAQVLSHWCGAGAPTPCVVAASVDGVAVTETDPVYDVVVVDSSRTGSGSLLWNVTANGDYDLGAGALGQEWSVTIDTGAVVPRVAFTKGAPGTVVRSGAPTANRVTVTSMPVAVTGGCDLSAWPWTCPETATSAWAGYLGGEVTDYGSWTDVPQRNAMYGYDIFTNIDATSLPAEIKRDAATGEERLVIRMANSHFGVDGTTLVNGFMYQSIPNRFLRQTYGIDNPGSLTAHGLDPSLSGGGTGTVSIVDGGSALVVNATDLSFSRRVLRLDRGVITPKKPVVTKTVRHQVNRARLRFDEGAARGSKVIRHRAKCTEIGGTHVVTRNTKSDTKIVVRGLKADTRYRCKVRAISKAGPGKWSKRVTVARLP